MSSDAITHPTWNRLHVARRVRDIAKSMMRLSRLGRSTFPMIVHRRLRRRGLQPSLRLKVWETVRPRSVHRPPAKTLSRSCRDGGRNEIEGGVRRRPRSLAGASCRFPLVPPSPGEAGAGRRPCAGGGGHGGSPSPAHVRGADLVVGPDARTPARGHREGALGGPDARQDLVHAGDGPSRPRGGPRDVRAGLYEANGPRARLDGPSRHPRRPRRPAPRGGATGPRSTPDP